MRLLFRMLDNAGKEKTSVTETKEVRHPAEFYLRWEQ